MIPIALEWRRPLDGAEIAHDDPDGGEDGVIRYRSERSGPISFRLSTLENSVALELLNTTGIEGLVVFVSKYGLPSPMSGGSSKLPRQPLALIEALKDDVFDILTTSEIGNPLDRVAQANHLLKYTTLVPSFEFSETENRQRLIFRPRSLEDLIATECAVALDVGASLLRCAHCSKAFLIGPHTGRRSHSTYCSDKCRVAATRARQAGKGAH